MKKRMYSMVFMGMGLLLAGCGAKETTDTFSQTLMEGATVSIIVTHKEDKVTKIAAETTLDNALNQITDEASAKEMVELFEEASELEDTEMSYSEKETVITYATPDSFLAFEESYEELETYLLDSDFSKE